MRHHAIIFSAVCLFGAVWGVRARATEIPVWPEGEIPLLKAGVPPEKKMMGQDSIVRLTNVNRPTLAVFPAKNNGRPNPAVMVCPGGGYAVLAIQHEGTEIARWLNRQGISAFVLKYRVPGQEQAAFCDAQRAFGLIRSRAAEYNLAPSQIGIIGFSAGAHLAVRLCTNNEKRFYQAVDAADALSCRPDFAMIIYPWHLSFTPDLAMGRQLPVSSRVPPTFLLQAEDDECKVENSLAYFYALKKAKVPAEMHLYPKGGHGYGMRIRHNPTDDWPSLAETWLKRILK